MHSYWWKYWIKNGISSIWKWFTVCDYKPLRHYFHTYIPMVTTSIHTYSIMFIYWKTRNRYILFKRMSTLGLIYICFIVQIKIKPKYFVANFTKNLFQALILRIDFWRLMKRLFIIIFLVFIINNLHKMYTILQLVLLFTSLVFINS